MEIALPFLLALLLVLRSAVLRARGTRSQREAHAGPAHWHDLFGGSPPRGARRPDIVVLEVTVTEAGQPVRYVGVLAGYCLDAGQGLDSLVLAAAERGDSSPQQPTAAIDEGYVVLRYAQVLTLSVRYLQFELAGARGSTPPLRGPELLAA